ncbi:hypothetical protein Tco_0990927 [Tanacetum coccineum]|uniref:Transposase n=1 Tax=Tanacetum coccineum TaxID=301880 RepID=A0ABQ5EXV1_9ASTR
MDNPNITLEEYIRLEEEKARRHSKVYNWETAKYGKIWYDEDVHDLRSVETEFPAIVFNDELSSEKTLSCEPTVSSLNNNEIHFRVSFDESDDEDYTVIFDKNSFSYEIISINDLKTDSENDNEKVNMPSFPSPEPKISIRHMAPLPPRDHRNLWLHYQVEGYTEETVHDFEQRLKTIFGRQVNREIFVSHAWRRLFEIRAPLFQEFILEFFNTCRIALSLHTTEEMAEDGFEAYWLGSERVIPDKGDLRGRHLKRHAEGRKSGARLSGGDFIGGLAHHFGLVSDDGLRGLSIMTRELPLIDIVAAAAALGGADDAPDVDEGA